MGKDPETLYFKASESIPNHPKLATLVYRNAIESSNGSIAEDFETRFKKNGWSGIWRWGVYDFHHYHSNAHEVLGVASGEAKLILGGPDGETVDVHAGDAIVLPAGTGHKNLSSSEDFHVVGAYPAGQEDKDLIRNDHPIDDTVRGRISAVALPEKDPVFGDDGPLLDEWR